MYRPTYAIHAIGRADASAANIAAELMTELLWCLVRVDEVYLRYYLDQFPPLFESGIRYGVIATPPKVVCGDDQWNDLAILKSAKMGDVKELVAARTAELRVRYHVPAKPLILADNRMVVLWPTPDRMPIDAKTGSRLGYPSHLRMVDGVGAPIEDVGALLGGPSGANVAPLFSRASGMYRPTFVIDAIGRAEDWAIDPALDIMGELLWCLVHMDQIYLRLLGHQLPYLYDAGIVYGDAEAVPGTTCGDDDWRDIGILYDLHKGDCEELASARCAELRSRYGVPAKPMVMLQRGKGLKRQRHLYHIVVRWPEPSQMPIAPNGQPYGYPSHLKLVPQKDGSNAIVEDPAEMLGMKPVEEVAA